MLQELATSSLRVWLFSPTILDIPIDDLKRMLPINAKTTTTLKVALRMFAFGWACSSWTKASLYLQRNVSIVTRKSTRKIGWIHLLIGSILLQTHKPKGVSYFPSRYPHIRLLLKTLGFGLLGYLVDEFLTLAVLFISEKRYLIKGIGLKSSVPTEQGCEECMICLTDTKEQLQSFCSSGHSAHPLCMEKWYRPSAPFSNCPLCRQQMNVLFKSIFHFGWFKEYRKGIMARFFLSSGSLCLMSVVYCMQMYALNTRLETALGISE